MRSPFTQCVQLKCTIPNIQVKS